MQKFCKGEANLGYLKKGVQLQTMSGGSLEDNVKN